MFKLNKQVLLRLVNSYGFHSNSSQTNYQDLMGEITQNLFEVNLAVAKEAKKYSAMKILSIERAKNNRMMAIHVDNLKRFEGKKALKYLFNLLKRTDDFIKFGENKVIFIIAEFEDENQVSYHHNVLINNKTTFTKYWNQVKNHVTEKFIGGNYGYSESVVSVYKVLVWNSDLLKNKHIKITKSATGMLKTQILGKRSYHTSANNSKTNGFLNSISGSLFNTYRGSLVYCNIKTHLILRQYQRTFSLFAKGFHTKRKFRGLNNITPLKPKKGKIDKTKRLGNLTTFSAMDIETMDFEGFQIPVAISITSIRVKGNIVTDFFTIDHTKLNITNGIPDKNLLDLEVTRMWLEFFNFLKTRKDFSYKTIFAHNLGGFDGVFIFTQLAKLLKPVTPSLLMDNSNKYIKISIPIRFDFYIEWKDSYRMFPVGLNKLCEIFGVEGKTMEYDERFNNFNLFNDKKLLKTFKKYARQDTISLVKALAVAQFKYFNEYHVDITDCLSASNLAMKIFRTNFMDINIPILKQTEDRFIRDSYYGGATDVYKAVCEKLHYIDVNSLYPFGMLKEMPIKLLEIITDSKILKDLKLKEFFGFLKVEVYCPSSVKKPMLPVKHEGKTIFPTGRWIGTYFSEEIKAVLSLNLGYEIRIIEAHSYSKGNIFKKFVEHFYQIKKTSKGDIKFLAKLCLNSLYGMFGRKQEVFQVFVVDEDTLHNLVHTKIIKNVVFIDEDLFLVSIATNVNNDILRDLNLSIDSEYTSTETIVKSNVAIASAVTAYGRILMMKHKVLDCVVYSDTDSLFTTDLEPFIHLLSDNLGDFKDELNGLVISKAIFLGIKQYVYQYFDKDNELISKSVFAGVKRNTLAFEDYENMLKGKEIKVNNGNRFIRSLVNLNIQIKPSLATIKQNNDKILVNNEYLPLEVNLLDQKDNKLQNVLNTVNTSYGRVLKHSK